MKLIPWLAYCIHISPLPGAVKWAILYSCFPSKRYVVNIASDFRLCVDVRDGLGCRIYRDKIWEPVLTTWFGRLCNSGMVVADVGANIGFFSLLSARLVGTRGHVYAFEPISENVRLLRESVNLNGCHERITVVPSAASDRSGSVSMRTSRGVPSGSATTSKPSGGLHSSQWVSKTVAVPSLTLDDYFDGLGIHRVDLVKVDIEGGEVQALKGMFRGLMQKRYRILMVEEHVQHDPSAPSEIREILQHAGYHLYRFSGEDYLVPDQPGWGGYIIAFLEPPSPKLIKR